MSGCRRCGRCPRCQRSILHCKAKRAHTSWEDAEEAARDVRAKTGDVITRYRCRWCGLWHIGHPGGIKKKVAVKRLEKARRKGIWK